MYRGENNRTRSPLLGSPSICLTENVDTMSLRDFALTDSPTICSVLWNTPRTMSKPMLMSTGFSKVLSGV